MNKAIIFKKVNKKKRSCKYEIKNLSEVIDKFCLILSRSIQNIAGAHYISTKHFLLGSIFLLKNDLIF